MPGGGVLWWQGGEGFLPWGIGEWGRISPTTSHPCGPPEPRTSLCHPPEGGVGAMTWGEPVEADRAVRRWVPLGVTVALLAALTSTAAVSGPGSTVPSDRHPS